MKIKRKSDIKSNRASLVKQQKIAVEIPKTQFLFFVFFLLPEGLTLSDYGISGAILSDYGISSRRGTSRMTGSQAHGGWGSAWGCCRACAPSKPAYMGRV